MELALLIDPPLIHRVSLENFFFVLVYDAGGNTKRNIETLAPSSGLLGSSTNFGNIGGATSGEFNIPPPIAGGATNLMSNNFDLGGFGSGGGSAFASVRSKYQTPFSGTLGRKMPGEVNRLGDPTDYLSQIPPSTTVNSAYNYKSGNGNNLSSSGLFGHPPPVRGTSGGSYNFPNSTGGANGNNSGGFGGGNTSILNQTSINSLLQQQFPPSLPPPPAPPAELNFDTISMIGGKSLQELTDLLAATTPDNNSSPFNMPPPSVNPQARSGGMSGPSYGNPSSFSGSGLGNVNNFGGHGGGLMDNMDPKISRPIGSERSRQNLAPGKQGIRLR